MTTLKLTVKKIKSFTYEGAVRVDQHGREAYDRDVRWDTEVSGLGLRVYPTGRKTFLLSYRVLGRKRMIALGRFGTIRPRGALEPARWHSVVAQHRSPSAVLAVLLPTLLFIRRQDLHEADLVDQMLTPQVLHVCSPL